MFNRKDTSFEIAKDMEKALASNAVDAETDDLNKMVRAIEHLNVAAELFDDVGLRKYAEITTSLLEALAGKKSKPKAKSKPKSKSRKSKKIDPATKGLTSEKMLDNLAHKGWVFNADDNSFDDNFVHHGDDCVCSMCMDTDDHMSHTDGCMCSMCMDTNDTNELDINDMKLDISSGGVGSSEGSPKFWRHMAKKYSREGDFRKAEEALMKAEKAEMAEKYDEELNADDFGMDFDTSSDFSYHVNRDPEKGYHLNKHQFDINDAMNDFEDEVDTDSSHRFY